MKRNLTKLICLLIVSALMLVAFAACNNTQPEETTSADTTVTEETTAEVTTVEVTTAEDTTKEETSAPETTTVEETSAPETTTVEETSAPETTAEETTAPETTAPETTVEETTVPETTVEETTVPETTVEITTAEDTSVEETTTVEETTEETTVPETTVEDTTEETTVPETTVEDTTEETTVPETTVEDTTEETTVEDTTVIESSEETTEEVTEEITTEEITTSYMQSLGLKEENLSEIMQNIFAGNVVKNETVFVIDKGETKKLLYPATEIISVTSYNGSIVYKEGVDYVLENGGIKILEGSSIPAVTSAVYYNFTANPAIYVNHNGANTSVYWGEGATMTQWQVSVTYKHESTWEGFTQPNSAKLYESLIKKLEAGEDVTFIFYGDSITCGATSSWFSGTGNQHSYSMLFTEAIADLFDYTVKFIDVSHLQPGMIKPTPEDYVGGTRGTITYINPSVGGWTSQNGVDNFNTFVKPYVEQYGCDLISVAFGMNDAAVNPNTTAANIKKIITSTSAIDSDLCAIVVSTMVPNNLATNGWYGNQDKQEAAIASRILASLNKDGIPTNIARMTSVSLSILEHKDFLDYTGNNINHPNDFFNRVYAQTLLQTVIGYENIFSTPEDETPDTPDTPDVPGEETTLEETTIIEETTIEETTVEETTVEETTEAEKLYEIEGLDLDASKLQSAMADMLGSGTMMNETVFIFDTDLDGTPKSLLFPIAEIVSVTNYSGSRTYTEGVDYEIVDGKLRILTTNATTRAAMKSSKYYGTSDSTLQTYLPDGTVTNTHWGENMPMSNQMCVTYKYTTDWEGFHQQSNIQTYEDVIKKLIAGEDVTFIFYGDSITCGANASWFTGMDPGQYSYPMLFTEAIADLFGYTVNYVNVSHLHSLIKATPENYVAGTRGTINFINPSVGGWNTAQGLSNFNTFVKPYIEQYGCDLLVLAFGMNDGGTKVTSVVNSTKSMIEKASALSDDLHVVIMSTMVPNNLAANGWYGNQDKQEAEFFNLAEEMTAAGVKTAVTQMTSMSLSILEYKQFIDYTGNNINHPNDFFGRVYAQTLFQSFIGYEYLK